ncbi:hypothetical protein [Jiella pelagia]|uniref:Uncharacterized protein n=1 Tax=Jiella pelagia TaxID=2986949 RepID=A0ABY7C5M0_9HYPH|nr:hypothetical protein [Jiella pelagia]WAP71377.1 hypothetical protein OH818_21530 [Jiella pelagia]
MLAAADFGPAADGKALASAMNRFTRIVQLLRLGPADVRTIGAVPVGLSRAIARAVDLDDPDGVEAWLAAETERVRAAFRSVLGAPPA